MPSDAEWRAEAQKQKDESTEAANNAATDKARWMAEGARHMAVHFLHWKPAVTP